MRRRRDVTGEVRLRLEPGRCYAAGRRAPRGLYDHDLATYDAEDAFRHEDSEGFVRLWGLSARDVVAPPRARDAKVADRAGDRTDGTAAAAVARSLR